MSRITYNTATPFGQLISEAIDHIHQATLKIQRSASAVTEMTAEQCESEISVAQDDFTNFRNRLNDIQLHLEYEKFCNLIVIFDQG
ncbi:hypothetical protein [Bacterioplanoides sp.]|uniref:hypothetical protein n=1 Tax=Bacterioplanoides sp. TaxID=2066072 RepID=UPI003B5B6E5B